MSSSRAHPQPVNLKERIAALQQHSSTPSTAPNTVNPHPTSNTQLREKIARFEKKGGVPVPRGSFGLGAPPPQGTASRRAGELYGNRIPLSLRAVSGPGPGPSQRATSPLGQSSQHHGAQRRSFSLSNGPGLDEQLQEETPPPESPSHITCTLATELSSSAPASSPSKPNPRPESQSQPPLQLGISFITTLEGITRPTALGSAKRTRTLVPATSVQVNESPSVKPVLISPSTSPTAPGSEPGPIEITPQATGLNSPGTGVAAEQNPAIHQSLMPPGDGSGSGAGFPDVELDVTPDSPSGDVVREGIKDNGKEVEVESNSNENEQTTNKGPPPVVGLDGVAVSPITSTASQLEPAKELQLVPRVQVNDQVVHDMPHDQIPSSPTTPHAPTFTLSSVPREDPPATISTSITEGLTPFNAHRPLSMPAINFSTCSNSSRRAPSPLTVCIPGSPTVERSTPIQATYDMESSGGEATDADQGTADACYPTAIQELLSPDRLGYHQQLQVQRVSHEAETAIGEPGSVRIVTGLEKPSSNFGATVREVHEPPRRPTSPSSLSPQSKTLVRRAVSATPLGTSESLDQKSGFPPGPGFGDLTDLLQSTVLLQERLERDVSPDSSSRTTTDVATNSNTSVPVIVADEDDGDDANLCSPHDPDFEVRRLSKEEVEENKRTLWRLQAKREEQARSKIRNGFFGPFGRASKDGSREATTGTSMDGVSQQQQLYSKRLKSPFVPCSLNVAKDNGPYSDAPGEANFRSKTPENQSTGSGNGKPSSLSSKSPKSGFPGFRLLASRSSPSSLRDRRTHGHYGYGRNSVSTSSEFSSEDSAPSVVTPPDGANEFGGLRSWLNMGSPQSKKGGDGMGNVQEKDGHMSRAVTFAGKIWQRARTRSGASTRSVQSLRGRLSHEPPALPSVPDISMASGGQAREDMLGPLPMRTASFLPRSPSSFAPSLPPKNLDMSPRLYSSKSSIHKGLQTYAPHSPGANSILSESPSSVSVACRSRSDLGSAPSLGQNSAKRKSWTSSASHCANSSMLDVDLFDAFPSVPENHPLVLPPSPSKYPYSLKSASAISLASSTLPGPTLLNRGVRGRMTTFDNALLSPTTHLTGSSENTGSSAYSRLKSNLVE